MRPMQPESVSTLNEIIPGLEELGIVEDGDEDEEELSDKDYMTLDEEFIALAIPDDTVEIDITAKIYFNHELHEVTKHMDFPEVRAAIREAKKGYIPSNALFCLRKTGRDKIEDLLDRYMNEENGED